MRYEDEIDRSRRRQSRGRETVKRSGNRNPAPNRQKELTLITDSLRRMRGGGTEGQRGPMEDLKSLLPERKLRKKKRKTGRQLPRGIISPTGRQPKRRRKRREEGLP